MSPRRITPSSDSPVSRTSAKRFVPQTGRERRLKLECTEPVVLITPRAEPVRTVREGIVGLTANLPPLRCGYRTVAAVVTGQPQSVCPFVARVLDLERGVCRLVLAVARGERSTELALALPIRQRVTRHAAEGDETDADPFLSMHHEPPVSP